MSKKNRKSNSAYQPKHETGKKSQYAFSTQSKENIEKVGSPKPASAPQNLKQKSDEGQVQDIFSSTARQIQNQEKAAQPLPKTEPQQPQKAEMQPMSAIGTKPAKKSKKRLIAKIAVLVFSVLFLVAGCGLIYGDMKLSQINYVSDASAVSVPVASYITSAEVNSNATTNLGNVSMRNGLYHDDAIKNILVMGVDDYRPNDVGRSDSMMIISVDTRHHELKTTSFLRDLYVNIPGCSVSNRINVAYSIGKAPLSVQTIESNFGVDIDNYITVDYSAFAKIIERLGGVTITVTDDEAKLINRYAYDDPRNELKGAGTYKLTGKQALYYSRIRIIGTDFARTQRQRKVFSSIIDKFKNSDLSTLNDVMSDVLKLVTTNMDKNKVIDLLTNSLTYMKYPVSQNCIPADNTYDFKDVTIGGVPGNSVIVANMKKNSLIAAKFIYEDDFNFPADDTSSNSVSAKSTGSTSDN